MPGKDRDRRYQQASEIRTDLERLKQGDRTPGLPRKTGLGAARFWSVGVSVAAVLALAAATYLYLHRTPKLTNIDTIVLADFENKTRDPVFDETLRQGLTVQLAQSPFLSLLSDERIQQTLRLMGRSNDARLTPQTAREVCERTGGAAVLDGSIASLGSQYVLGLRARNCRSGDVLAQDQETAAGEEDVVNALTRMARKFRTQVGESLATVKSSRHSACRGDHAIARSAEGLHHGRETLFLEWCCRGVAALRAGRGDRSTVRRGPCMAGAGIRGPLASGTGGGERPESLRIA